MLRAPVINLAVCMHMLFFWLRMRTLLIRFVHMCVLFGTGAVTIKMYRQDSLVISFSSTHVATLLSIFGLSQEH